MARQYKLISADSHAEVPNERWIHRIAEEYRDRGPHTVTLPDGADGTQIGDMPPRQNPMDLYGGKGRDLWQPFGQKYDETPGTGSPEQRIEEQERDKTDAEVMFPAVVVGPLYWMRAEDPGLQNAIFPGWNDWLVQDYCSHNPDRLIPVGTIPGTGVDGAVAELNHCADMGVKAVVLGSFPNGSGRPSDDDDRFWEASLKRGVKVCLHVQLDRSRDPNQQLLDYPVNDHPVLKQTELTFQVQRFARVGGTNVVQLVMSHLFERYPELEIGCLEMYLGWVPFFLEMADVRYDRHIHWAEKLLGYKPLPEEPSKIIKRHFHWGFQQDRSGIELRHHLWVDHLMWASDFPHQESDWPDSKRVIDHNFAGVPADEVYAMTCGNAAKFFGIGGY